MSDDRKRRDFAQIVTDLSSGKARLEVVDGDGNSIFDATRFVLDVVRANRGWQEPDDDTCSLFLTEGREAVRSVGEDINRQYGFHGMVAVHDCISDILPTGAARELEFAWEGIGEWKS